MLPESWYPQLQLYEHVPVDGWQVPVPFEMEQLTASVPEQLPAPLHTSPLVQALLSLHDVPAAEKPSHVHTSPSQ